MRAMFGHAVPISSRIARLGMGKRVVVKQNVKENKSFGSTVEPTVWNCEESSNTVLKNPTAERSQPHVHLDERKRRK